jgi:hypothetical protein
MAQETAPVAIETTVVASPSPAANILPAGTAIDLEFVDPVDSKANKVGDIIAMKVADDVMAGSAVIIPAGTPVSAEVIHAAKASGGGYYSGTDFVIVRREDGRVFLTPRCKPLMKGELSISARYIQLVDKQIVLKNFKFGTSGANRNSQNNPLFIDLPTDDTYMPNQTLCTRNGDKHVNIGTRAFAKLKDDFDYTAILTPKQVSAPEIIPAQNAEVKNQ